MSSLTRGMRSQGWDVRHADPRGHRDQRHRDVGGRRGGGGAVHRARHRRLPSAQGRRPTSELNDTTDRR